MNYNTTDHKIKVGIIGATGYAGVELLRLLLSHPYVEIASLSSVSFEGKPISEVYPNLKDICDDVLTNEEEVLEKSDVVFASLPHGLSEPFGKKCVEQDKLFIDLGADFRLYDEKDYTEWYNLPYKEKDLHKVAVYCIPELHRSLLKGKKIIGNPGCYPTSISLGLAPLFVNDLAVEDRIIIDSKSGVSGSGRGLSQMTHYPDCNEAFAPYKIAVHRHTPEIEQNLSGLAKRKVTITFVPHLLPVNRGILSTMYVDLKENKSIDELLSLYKEFYKNEKFVRVLDKGNIANIKNVRLSNYCEVSLHKDERTNRLIVVSAIDNMVKGAAGQAIQNMNIALEIPEDTAINMITPSV